MWYMHMYIFAMQGLVKRVKMYNPVKVQNENIGHKNPLLKYKLGSV